MVNIAMLLGNGPVGEDSMRMGPWTRYLQDNHNLYTISRISESAHLGNPLKEYVGEEVYDNIKNEIYHIKNRSKKYLVIYDSPKLQKTYNKKEIDEMQNWLGVSFKYISSFDRRFYNKQKMKDIRNEDELYNYMTGLTKLFKDFFVENQIKVFINSLEDLTFSVLANYVAKRLGIVIVGFVGSRFPKKGRLFCKDFSEVICYNDENVNWNEIKVLYSEDTLVQEETLTKNKQFLSLFSFQRFKDIKKFLKSQKFIKNAINHQPYEKFSFEPSNLFKELKNYINKFIRTHAIYIFVERYNKTDKYFLFPLHYMEDAQITFREPLLDQFDLIKKISRSLPLGYFLYVKPHPHYLGSDISLGDLFSLRNLKNVKLIDPKSKPLNVIKSSEGVITINSTAGFEALIQNRPVITVGHDFYCKNDICFVVRDINDLSEVFIEALNVDSNKDKIKEFIEMVYVNTVWIDGFGPTFESCGLTEDDGKTIAKSLNCILDNIDNNKK